MKVIRSIMCLMLFLWLLSGCKVLDNLFPSSLGEINSGYTYVPIDSIPISDSPGRSCDIGDKVPYTNSASKYANADLIGGVDIGLEGVRLYYKKLLDSFPDNAVRVSVEQIDSEGKVSILGSSVGANSGSYRVIVDYIISDTVAQELFIKKDNGSAKDSSSENRLLMYTVHRSVELNDNEKQELLSQGYELYNIPLYVGIGLRITANIYSVGGKVNLVGLGAIGAAADAGRIKGSLVVQTLGVNGKAVSSALPIQSELNRTTVQNAIVAIGAIKALLYDQTTQIEPRVVGLYLPFESDKNLVNKIISSLSKNSIPIKWHRPCALVEIDDEGSPMTSGNIKKAWLGI